MKYTRYNTLGVNTSNTNITVVVCIKRRSLVSALQNELSKITSYCNECYGGGSVGGAIVVGGTILEFVQG